MNSCNLITWKESIVNRDVWCCVRLYLCHDLNFACEVYETVIGLNLRLRSCKEKIISLIKHFKLVQNEVVFKPLNSISECR